MTRPVAAAVAVAVAADAANLRVNKKQAEDSRVLSLFDSAFDLSYLATESAETFEKTILYHKRHNGHKGKMLSN